MTPGKSSKTPIVGNLTTLTMNNLHFDQSPDDVWEHFYNTQPNSEPIQGTNVQARSTNNECFLYNCIFIEITTKSAIYFTNTSNKFLNSDCSFTNCSSNTNGGSIYFKCNSSIVQYRTCGYKSKTNSDWGHHSYVDSYSNNKNYLYESSFYLCGNLGNSRINSLYYGNIEVKSINTSFCEADYDSGIFLWYTTSLSNVTYSSFCNTTSNNLILELDVGNYNFYFCNVLNNEHKKSDYGTFYGGASTVLIENCSFLGNTGPGVEFYQWGSGSITVKDSFCDRIDKTYGSVTTNNVQNIYSIHHHSHVSSYLCEAELPIIDKKPMKSAFDLYHQFSFRRRRYGSCLY
ncbi:hypothetical protein TVAG_402590 [Trichomonas vaginalis G3]|uniref:Right handed beta helix domain-containing protein n=1 Tax=Trichomonas vaginalis (strain ATCC PRA-98 / G3) TaxID=412133 RepID=A2DI14_TRIV3|nr:hypothetical protein TVAGG3_0272200 [Trichomonas vaginalis G3]EAY20003.1 hypothetical protein TVAG_402590 [Trichomonas vaginalis G3]KAI5525954.1 hypothetical protein TVAGG3_0272200 [Trichomonas vaginalis G3]|eukprot:XP_001580989.1 hypothetical protein [Trichomonas vaginalis G3]